MRLRSRKTISECSSIREGNPGGRPKVPRTARLKQTTDPVHTKDEESLDMDSTPSAIPMATRRSLALRRARKRDLAFKTPVRPTMRHHRILAEIDPASPCSSTARNIYSPIVHFLTPSKENVKSPSSRGDTLSPQQCVFGYNTIDHLVDEDNDIFSPFTFIKNIPSRSQCPKHSLRDIPPKTRSTPEPTLVLDLDETLMFSSLNKLENAEYTFHVTFQDHQYKVYVLLRPYVKEFLQAVVKLYELFVYTSAKKDYAEKILDILDPEKKLFRHRFYQEHCTCILGHYVKDLGVLKRDLTKTVVLDNAPHTYPYHLMNTIPIKSWCGEREDKDLQGLIPYLEKLAGAEDFLEVLKRRKDHFHRLLSED
ncbi:CTD small phosphatase-like protein 3 isoform X2 [Lampris incognitus]|uniref:CTD small phosphatase-like protein 3 isoform X2 n=2 Tax=Lampris incognitus TaxID=2546036 RepID=UPI0024B57066|nr:CTD small phosphatase-like protein 3 isoform X2 [Lampris incognitus]